MTSNDQWLTEHGFVETKCYSCSVPVIKSKDKYSQYVCQYCESCQAIEDRRYFIENLKEFWPLALVGIPTLILIIGVGIHKWIG